MGKLAKFLVLWLAQLPKSRFSDWQNLNLCPPALLGGTETPGLQSLESNLAPKDVGVSAESTE